MSFIRIHFPLTAGFLILTVMTTSLLGCGQEHDQAEPDEVDAKVTVEMSGDQSREPAQPGYLANPPKDPRAALIAALGDGLLTEGMSNNEKLAAVLEVTGVPEASQVLVFSKTSLQLRLISPSNPRAIYFNDNCYIGYVPGGLIEYGDVDPDPAIGSGLFAIDPSQDAETTLQPDNSCLSCHEGSRTNSRPGFMVRSVFPDPQGHVITSAGSTVVGHDTPLAKRWGGWYVTGQSGDTHHRGNQVTVEHPDGDAYIDNALGSNIDDLSHRFNTERYLQPTSDIVALMVLEHQVQMHNLLTQGNSVVHDQYERSKELAKYLEEPFEPSENETLQRVIESNAGRIVKHLLFCDEVALTEPVVGSEVFQSQFRANRREDTQGRSLKDFDLQTRLFRYRCSYMVYSRAFELLHPLLKDAVAHRLRAVLSGEEQEADFDHLSAEERAAILQILTETGVL